MNNPYHYDVLIIGGGAAGLALALELSSNANIAILSKNRLQDGSTWYAQGGIAAVLDDKDSIDAHVKDTLSAGAGLCHEDVAKFTVSQSASAVQWLIDQGVQFTRDLDEQDYHLTQEGGHSHRRIIHSADATGKAVQKTLMERIHQQPSISIYEHHIAVDLIQQPAIHSARLHCSGAYVFDREQDLVKTFQAKVVVLATGGASKAYLYTSNPDGASGDGIAMAWRAGCRVANMEFNQFHPTCLYHPSAKTVLISEALRGEGAHLTLPNGNRFMERFDSRGELAPRDIVARAIDHEMKRLGHDHLYLDISHKPAAFIQSHFPNILNKCLQYGIDITQEAIPIVPAAHYTCGGVVVDQHGQTDLLNLYAIGEASFTGLHGANRMASNSLLECVVYARSAASHIQQLLPKMHHFKQPDEWDESQVTNSDEDVVIAHNWDELRRFMWDYVGIVRTQKRLERAQHRIKLLLKEITEYYSNYKVSNDLIELRNLATVSQLIIRSAMERKESRGLHFSLDYPEPGKIARDTILVPTNFAAQNIIINSDESAI